MNGIPKRPESVRIAVIGDLILDRYTWGNATRISPEAPIPILLTDQEEVRAGGAASVAVLLRALEAEVHLFGVVGTDPESQSLRRVFEEQPIVTTGMISIDDRPTTLKHRFVGRSGGRHPHQILRVDREATCDISAAAVHEIHGRLASGAPFNAILISDYAKGVCTPDLIRRVMETAGEQAIPVLVDPGRGRQPDLYRGATLLKPNRMEARDLLGRAIVTPQDAIAAADELRALAGVETVVITLDRDGIGFAALNERAHAPTSSRDAYDNTGAGDMTLAMLGYGAAAGWPLAEAVRFANVAAGLQIERFGIEPVFWAEIEAALQPGQRSSDRKIGSFEDITQMAAGYRCSGRRIAFTNGCFDLFHSGHLATLEEAAAQGDVLIVALNSDASVARLKGPSRPLIGQEQRARTLAALACVDHVVVFDEPTPHRLLRAIRPDALVKGGSTDDIVGREIVEGYGGRVHRAALVPGLSTTRLIESICEGERSPPVPVSSHESRNWS